MLEELKDAYCFIFEDALLADINSVGNLRSLKAGKLIMEMVNT